MELTPTLILNLALLIVPPVALVLVFRQWLARHIRWTVALTALCDVLLFWDELFYYESFGLFAVLILVQLAATGAAAFHIYNKQRNVNFRDSNNLYLYSTEFVGNLPDKENEVAVSEAYLKHIGRPVELNQEIELPLQNGKNANFTVCGLLHDDGANRRYQVLVSDSFLQSYFQDHIPYNATLRIMGSGSFKEDELKNLIKSCLTPYGIREEQIAYSSSYFDSVDNSSRDMLGVAAISILIVIACSTVIYSLFYISVVGKVKEYGRLRVIGMTQKQIKRMVKRESWQLSRTSIPLGIVVGCLIGYLTRN